MGIYVSPGVYTREKDISQIIPNIATTTAALVGYSPKGDVDDYRLITNSQQFIEEYGEPVLGQYFHYTALAFLENGNKLYCMRVHNGAKYGGVKIMYSGGTNAAIAAGASTKTFQAISGVNLLFYIFGKDPGTWNNDLGIRVTNSDAAAYTFDIEVYEKDADGVYQEVESWSVSRKHKIDGFGRQMYLETRINGYSKYIAVADSAVADTTMPVAQATTLALAQGAVGSAVSDSNVATGWDVFANPDEVDVRLLINGGYSGTTVQSKMKTIAESRKDCIAILDVPSDQIASVTSTTDWRTITQNFNSSYCALYSPWTKVNDPYNDVIVEVPPSGYVASMMAYNDYVADPWYAPAGFNRGLLNVLGLTKIYTEGERDTLYAEQINPLQTYIGEGHVIWGQKTEKTSASALDRVNVRRLLITIEKSISATLRYFAFEPNNENTRFRVTAMVDEYMNKLSARGAFQTEAGDSGFRVVCDATNNTPATIDDNELHVDIFIKPTKAAEFIQLQAIITTTGASFEELIARGINL